MVNEQIIDSFLFYVFETFRFIVPVTLVCAWPAREFFPQMQNHRIFF